MNDRYSIPGYSPGQPADTIDDSEPATDTCHFCDELLSETDQQRNADEPTGFPTCLDCSSDPAPDETEFVARLMAVRQVFIAVLAISVLAIAFILIFVATRK